MFFTCLSRTHRSGRSAERGSALVGVLLLLLMMTALASALAVSGHTETIVARNHQSAAQARAAAEAGLNHATQVVFSWILAWKTNDYDDVAAALDDLLLQLDGNPDFLTGVTFGDGADPTAIDGAADGEYHVFLMDEDDDALRGEDSTDLATDDDASNNEDGNALTDNNRTLVLQAVGYAGRLRPGANRATARLEAIISPYKLPAVVVDGDLTISGSKGFQIAVGSNANGGVHANGAITTNGSPNIVGSPDPDKGTVTSTEACDECADIASNSGDSGGNKTPVELPSFQAEDFEDWADFVLTAAGELTNASSGAVIQNCTGGGNPCDSYGLRFSKKGEWTFRSEKAAGIYYVHGDVSITGGTSKAPLVATIIATGSITAGGGYMRPDPDAADILLVTDVDLELSGNFTANVDEGQILVGEQADISGNVSIRGQILIQDDPTTADPHTNSISGSVTITNDASLGDSFFRVSGWREVR